MVVKIRKLRYKNIAWIMLALIPIINDVFVGIEGNNFTISNIFLGFLLIYILTMLIVKKKAGLSKYTKFLCGYYFYNLFISLISSALFNVSIPIEYIYHILVMLAIIVYFSRENTGIESFWKTLYLGSAIQVVLLFVQEVSFLSTGSFITYVLNAQEERPAALYSEPAHYCIFMVLILFSLLFQIDRLNISEKKRIIAAIAVSLSIIFSSSSSGLIYLGFVWGTWMLFYKRVRVKFVSLFFVVIGVAYLITMTDFFEVAYKHLMTMDMHSVNSGAFRIFRGFDLYVHLPFANKIFGYGLGQTGNIVKEIGFYSIYDNIFTRGSDYVSGLSSIILESGLIGLIAYLIFMIRIFNSGKIQTKLLITLYLLLIFSNEILYTPQIFLVLLLALREQKMERICHKADGE